MVAAYVESIIEGLTGVDKAVVDDDGDYPIDFRGARFWAQVIRREPVIVRLFTVVLSEIEPSPDLFSALNDINARAILARAFFASGAVMFEHELVGDAVRDRDVIDALQGLALASDHFGVGLFDRFSGSREFSDSQTQDYVPPDDNYYGYL